MRVLPIRQRRLLMHARCHRRLPGTRPPLTFNDKLHWRIMNDRRPIIGVVCDKLATKQYVAATVDCPQTYWSGSNLDDLRAVDLPDNWVLKPNHRSGFVHIGSGTPDIDELREVTRGWLDRGLETFMGEWGYSQADPILLAEEHLGVPGDVPEDFKFFVFDGELALVQYDAARFTGHLTRFYSPDWEPLDGRAIALPLAPIAPRPPCFDEMVRIAKRIGRPFDFIRVDLYNVNGRIYLGELTPYHCGGLEAFDPVKFDRDLGARWTLPHPSAITNGALA